MTEPGGLGQKLGPTPLSDASGALWCSYELTAIRTQPIVKLACYSLFLEMHIVKLRLLGSFLGCFMQVCVCCFSVCEPHITFCLGSPQHSWNRVLGLRDRPVRLIQNLIEGHVQIS